MADVQINQNPQPVSGGGSSAWILGVIAVVALLLVVWLLFARPSGAGNDVHVNVPEVQAPKTDAPAVEVKVPEKVDVNVNHK
jgi:hypothetical protein